MGAKTWMVVQAEHSTKSVLANSPQLNRAASKQFAERLFPDENLVPLEDGDLLYTSPPDDELYVGDFGQAKVIAAHEFGIDYPSKLPSRYISQTGTTTLHAMHSVVDWFAFAHWVDGELVRSLSLSPDSGVIEDSGSRMEFEIPFWEGKYPAVEDDEDDYVFDFHPLDLGEAALLYFFGYQIEGVVVADSIEAEDIPLLCFKRSRLTASDTPWWKFWA